MRYRQSATVVQSGRLVRLARSAQEGERNFDPLMTHSDADGYYLPIDFGAVLVSDKELDIAGGMLGSSVRLLAECERIAASLGIPQGANEHSETLFEAMRSQGEGDALWQRYTVESYTCVALMRGCQESIEIGAALAFV